MRRDNLRLLIGRVAVVMLAASCAQEKEPNWTGIVETLPSGSVRVTNPPSGVWESGGAWRLVTELVLGQTDGDGPDVFASISGLEVDGAGNIYVLDRRANDLRVFSPEGNHIRTVGRSGKGPAEYTSANGLLWIAADTLLVIDQQGARYSVLDRDGTFIRAIPRQLGFYGWVFEGGIDADRVYESSYLGNADPILVLLGTQLREGGLNSGLAPEIGLETGRRPAVGVDTIALAPPDVPMYSVFSIRTERGGMVMGVPFTGTPKYHLDGKGGVWHGHGDAPLLYHSTLAGDTLMEIHLGFEPVAVSRQELEEWEAQPSIDRFRELGGKLDLGRIPKTKPYFNGIASDSKGNIWLTVPAAAGTVRFALIDSSGRYLGAMDIHNVTRDEFLSPVLRNERLYFVGSDELDVQRVYVYKVVGS